MVVVLSYEYCFTIMGARMRGWGGVVYAKEKFKASHGFDFLSFVVAWMDGDYGGTCFLTLAASSVQDWFALYII